MGTVYIATIADYFAPDFYVLGAYSTLEAACNAVTDAMFDGYKVPASHLTRRDEPWGVQFTFMDDDGDAYVFAEVTRSELR